MDPKFIRIRELIDLKEKTDAELATLVDGVEKPKRTWTRRKAEEPTVTSS
jgi:hypothetical protein